MPVTILQNCEEEEENSVNMHPNYLSVSYWFETKSYRGTKDFATYSVGF